MVGILIVLELSESLMLLPHSFLFCIFLSWPPRDHSFGHNPLWPSLFLSPLPASLFIDSFAFDLPTLSFFHDVVSSLPEGLDRIERIIFALLVEHFLLLWYCSLPSIHNLLPLSPPEQNLGAAQTSPLKGHTHWCLGNQTMPGIKLGLVTCKINALIHALSRQPSAVTLNAFCVIHPSLDFLQRSMKKCPQPFPNRIHLLSSPLYPTLFSTLTNGLFSSRHYVKPHVLNLEEKNSVGSRNGSSISWNLLSGQKRMIMQNEHRTAPLL